MALPGLLIEYLISGALSLIWLYPLMDRVGIVYRIETQTNTAWTALFVLGLYFIGMLVDIIAWFITRPLKRKLRNEIAAKYGMEYKPVPGTTHVRQARFAVYAPELAKESAMRSSRDRIARGAIINAVIGTTVYLIISTKIMITLAVGIGLIVGCFFMWWGFEKVSFGFELKADEVISQKIEVERKSKP
jgi:ABC-type phosphate transport system permease subunit